MPGHSWSWHSWTGGLEAGSKEKLPALPTADRIEADPNTVAAAAGTQSEPGLGVKTVVIGFHKPSARVLCMLDCGAVVSPPAQWTQKNNSYRVLMRGMAIKTYNHKY